MGNDADETMEILAAQSMVNASHNQSLLMHNVMHDMRRVMTETTESLVRALRETNDAQSLAEAIDTLRPEPFIEVETNLKKEVKTLIELWEADEMIGDQMTKLKSMVEPIPTTRAYD